MCHFVFEAMSKNIAPDITGKNVWMNKGRPGIGCAASRYAIACEIKLARKNCEFKGNIQRLYYYVN